MYLSWLVQHLMAHRTLYHRCQLKYLKYLLVWNTWATLSLRSALHLLRLLTRPSLIPDLTSRLPCQVEKEHVWTGFIKAAAAIVHACCISLLNTSMYHLVKSLYLYATSKEGAFLQSALWAIHTEGLRIFNSPSWP